MRGRSGVRNGGLWLRVIIYGVFAMGTCPYYVPSIEKNKGKS